MAVLVLAEHSNTTLNDATAKAVTAAIALGGDVHVLVAGSDAKPAAEAAAKLAGVAKVLLADDGGLTNASPRAMTRLSRLQPPTARTPCPAPRLCSMCR
jgi:electron transfer flavoprotein alpha subunit